jgi:hypothetical protein
MIGNKEQNPLKHRLQIMLENTHRTYQENKTKRNLFQKVPTTYPPVACTIRFLYDCKLRFSL